MSYRVQRGDTLSAIAGRFHTSVATLAKLNHLANPNLILVGQVLKTTDGVDAPRPAPSPAPAPTTARASGGPLRLDSRVAMIGDSHTAGAFGSAFKSRLENGVRRAGGKITSFIGVPSASVSQYLNGGSTQAGSQTFRVPSLASILAKKPKTLVVALGTNMLFNSKSFNESQIRALLRKTDAAGTKVVWIGPPDVRGFGGELRGGAPEQRFYDALKAVNASRRNKFTIVDSRPSTNEGNTLDGVHFGGSAARTWAQDVYRRATTA
ncbi:MAG: LysM peptidoglycan-binding domain-containing protein [Archangium sp.]